jgi:hypothetical protein
VEPAKAACEAQIDAKVGFLAECPTACYQFTTLMLNNPCAAPVVAKVLPNVSAALQAVEGNLTAKMDEVCSDDCLQGTIGPLVSLVPDCVVPLLEGYPGNEACESIYPVLLNSTCKPLVALNECLIWLPTVEPAKAACEAKLDATPSFLSTCPTACYEFTTLMLNNPCAAPVVAKLAPNVSAALQAVEGTLTGAANWLCDECMQGSIEPVVKNLPACFETLLDGLAG